MNPSVKCQWLGKMHLPEKELCSTRNGRDIEAQIAKKLSVCSLIELILDDGILLICRYR